MSSWENVFNHATQTLFKALENEDVLNLNWSSEESVFLRFNQSKIRQITQVEQATLEIQYILGKKNLSHSLHLSKNSEQNKILLLDTLADLKKTVPTIPDDPHFTPLQNHGQNHQIHEGALPSIDEFLDFIKNHYSKLDMAGIFIKGNTQVGSANSLGQKHWFSAESFVFNYSLYNAKEKAVKGNYGGTHFNPLELKTNLDESLLALSMMDRPQKTISPGKWRCYLAPSAVAEIVGILGWHALSAGAYKRGDCSFKELADKTKTLNPIFNLFEDFSLGFRPRFNSRGEVFAERLPIIQNGELKNLFVSSKTAKEYGLISNQAQEDESPRASVILPGALKRDEILKQLGTGLYISNLHYLNWSDKIKGRITGMTRFGCLWAENGQIIGPIKDLRFDETLYHLFGEGLLSITDFSETFVETSTYSSRSIGATQTPGMLIDNMQFTL